MSSRKRGLRCSGCRAVTMWAALTGPQVETQILCEECVDDVLAMIASLRREHNWRPAKRKEPAR